MDQDGVFDAVPHLRMRGRDDIIAMVGGDGHQSLLSGGCGHVLTVPHIVVDGDEATGRSYALQVRWDAGAGRFWVFRVSANTWRWCVPRRAGASPSGSTLLSTEPPGTARCWLRSPLRAFWRKSEDRIHRAGSHGPANIGRLVAAGHDVRVLVRRPQARADAEAAGLPWAGTVAATVRDADAVFVVC